MIIKIIGKRVGMLSITFFFFKRVIKDLLFFHFFRNKIEVI
jgi:hypothetical protein